MGLSACNIQALEPHFTPDDTVLVAPLHWGLGHAARCIPVIQWLNERCREIIIASDGAALELLKKEFPALKHETLPAYGIRYTYENILVNITIGSLRILKAIYQEHNEVPKLVQKHKITKILSDNRLGLYHPDITSLYITHQVKILHPVKWIRKTGNYIHQEFIHRFHHCLVPDYQGSQALCPDLSNGNIKNATFTGPITRIGKLNIPMAYDILVLLSGPEPQRTILENKLLDILGSLEDYTIAFVRGIQPSLTPASQYPNHISFFSFASGAEIERLLNSSKLLIARSGYSTVMDMHQLDIKTIWIPTPGQTEQEYLAERLSTFENNTFLKQKDLNLLEEYIKITI